MPFPLTQTQDSPRGTSLECRGDREELPTGTAVASRDGSCRERSGIVMEKVIPCDNVPNLLVLIVHLKHSSAPQQLALTVMPLGNQSISRGPQ